MANKGIKGNKDLKRIAALVLILLLASLSLPCVAEASSGIEIVGKSGDGIWDANTWKVQIYPGESKSTTITLRNSSSSSLRVEVNISPDSLDDGNLTFELDKANFTMPRRSYADVTLTLKASGSATPGTYATELLEIKSEVPPSRPKPSAPAPEVTEPEEEPVEEPEIVEPIPSEPEPTEPIPPIEPEEPEVVQPEEEEPEVIEPEVVEPEVIEPGEEEEEVIVLPAKPGTPWGLIGGIVGGLAATGGVGYWLWLWRRRRKETN